MIRKMLVIAAAIAMPVSIVAASGGMAGASNSHSAASDTVSCKTLSGTVTFSPKLDAKGYTAGHISTHVTATVTGCTVKGSTHITITKGSVSGTLVGATGKTTAATGKCTSLVGNTVESGTLTTTWTASKGGPVPKSGLGIKSVLGGTVGTSTTGHGTFTIPGTTKGAGTGSFVGTNKGGSDKAIAETALSPSAILGGCLKSGTSTLKIQTETGKTALAFS
jgi:hypothetical protein